MVNAEQEGQRTMLFFLYDRWVKSCHRARLQMRLSKTFYDLFISYLSFGIVNRGEWL